MAIDFIYEDQQELMEKNYEDQFSKIILETVKQLNIEDDIEMSCIIVDEKEIHRINKDYRQIDRPTDVISFALEDEMEFKVEGMPRELGDIFISSAHVYEQAKEYGHSVDREMCFLFTHGLLHLLGYDHMNESDEKAMFSLQDQILTSLNITR